MKLKKPKVKLNEPNPIQISWDAKSSQALVSIELQEKEVLTLMISKNELMSLKKDIAYIEDGWNGRNKASKVDVLKQIPDDLKPITDEETITVSGKLYKSLCSAYKENEKLKQANSLLKKTLQQNVDENEH